MTTTNPNRYLVGKMVIPLTDEMEAKLKGDYTNENLARVFPEIFADESPCQFLKDSVKCVDEQGFDAWCDGLSTQLEDISRRVTRNYLLLHDIEQAVNKPSFSKRIFRRKKQ